MRVISALAIIAPLVLRASAWEAKGTYETVSYENQQMALKCLDMNFCDAHRLQRGANARCRVNDAVAAVCNYSREQGVRSLGLNYCSIREMWRAMGDIEKVDTESKTGWWFEPDWAKSYFFTKSRGSHEREDQCDNNGDFWQFDMECGDHIEAEGGCINHAPSLPHDWWSFQYPPSPFEDLDTKGRFRPKKPHPKRGETEIGRKAWNQRNNTEGDQLSG